MSIKKSLYDFTTVKWKAAMFREYGWRRNRAPYKPPVTCYGVPRFPGNGKRYVPRLAWQERREGGMLWAGGSRFWRTSVSASPDRNEPTS